MSVRPACSSIWRPVGQLLGALLGAALLLAALPTLAQAPNDPPDYLEMERKALQYRLKKLKATAEQDLRIRKIKRDALERATVADGTALGGEGDFLAVHKSHISDLLATVFPLRWEGSGFRFDFEFDKKALRFSPEGIIMQLPFRVVSDALEGSRDAPPRGTLRLRLSLAMDAEGGLMLHPEPQMLELEDRYYRAERTLLAQVKPESLGQVLPNLPLPLVLPSKVTWQGLEQPIQLRCDPARALLLQEQILLPFQLVISSAPPRKVKREAATPAPATPPTTIPMGRTPETTIPVGRTPGGR